MAKTPTQLTMEAKWDDTIKKIKTKTTMVFGTRKFTMKNNLNFLYFHRATSFRDGAPHTHALQDGGIVSMNGNEVDRYFEKVEAEFSSDRKRKCYNCQKEISYSDFYISNQWKMNKEQLRLIWESPYIELYCCKCYRKKDLFEKLEKKRERLLNKAYRINEKFGFLE